MFQITSNSRVVTKIENSCSMLSRCMIRMHTHTLFGIMTITATATTKTFVFTTSVGTKPFDFGACCLRSGFICVAGIGRNGRNRCVGRVGPRVSVADGGRAWRRSSGGNDDRGARRSRVAEGPARQDPRTRQGLQAPRVGLGEEQTGTSEAQHHHGNARDHCRGFRVQPGRTRSRSRGSRPRWRYARAGKRQRFRHGIRKQRPALGIRKRQQSLGTRKLYSIGGIRRQQQQPLGIGQRRFPATTRRRPSQRNRSWRNGRWRDGVYVRKRQCHRIAYRSKKRFWNSKYRSVNPVTLSYAIFIDNFFIQAKKFHNILYDFLLYCNLFFIFLC